MARPVRLVFGSAPRECSRSGADAGARRVAGKRGSPRAAQLAAMGRSDRARGNLDRHGTDVPGHFRAFLPLTGGF